MGEARGRNESGHGALEGRMTRAGSRTGLGMTSRKGPGVLEGSRGGLECLRTRYGQNGGPKGHRSRSRDLQRLGYRPFVWGRARRARVGRGMASEGCSCGIVQKPSQVRCRKGWMQSVASSLESDDVAKMSSASRWRPGVGLEVLSRYGRWPVKSGRNGEVH